MVTEEELLQDKKKHKNKTWNRKIKNYSECCILASDPAGMSK